MGQNGNVIWSAVWQCGQPEWEEKTVRRIYANFCLYLKWSWTTSDEIH